MTDELQYRQERTYEDILDDPGCKDTMTEFGLYNRGSLEHQNSLVPDPSFPYPLANIFQFLVIDEAQVIKSLISQTHITREYDTTRIPGERTKTCQMDVRIFLLSTNNMPLTMSFSDIESALHSSKANHIKPVISSLKGRKTRE